jgi:molybdopterin/thiamine biosynthesis adenylyltransferase
MILDINPDCEITCFKKGVQLGNIDEFLNGVDIVADGLDLYASELRTPMYERAYEKGIYVVSSGPFGMGTAVMAFHPEKMSFNKYFDLDKKNLTVESQIIRFLVGMSPSMPHRKYIKSPEHVQLFNGRLPSLHVGCYAASAAMGSTILKIALERGDVLYAPRGYQVDFYLNSMTKFWRPFGNRNPWQRMKVVMAHKMFKVQEFN